MRTLLLLAFALFASAAATAQSHLKWTFATKSLGDNKYELLLTATLDEGYCTYSQVQESADGPLPTEIEFTKGSHYQLIEKAVERGDLLEIDDPVFGMRVRKFKHAVVFAQQVVLLDKSKPITGTVAAMVCNDDMCFPPVSVDFSFLLK